jgi:hypothetical protein
MGEKASQLGLVVRCVEDVTRALAIVRGYVDFQIQKLTVVPPPCEAPTVSEACRPRRWSRSSGEKCRRVRASCMVLVASVVTPSQVELPLGLPARAASILLYLSSST